MSNPLFNMLNQPDAGMSGLLQKFQQFRNTFRGDPKQQVQELLNSGKITQQQYDKAVQQAKAFQKMFGL